VDLSCRSLGLHLHKVMSHKTIQFPVLCLTTDVSELERFVFNSSSPDLHVKLNKTDLKRCEFHVCFHNWNQVKNEIGVEGRLAE
jgi:hypothetical protein